MDFGDFNNFNAKTNSRDKLEITDTGNSRAEEKEKKEKERQIQRFGNGGRNHRGSYNDGNGFKIITKIIFWLFLLFVVFLLNLKYDWVTLEKMPLKLSQEEGVGNMLDTVKDIKEQKDIAAGVDKELPEVYKKNNIHDGVNAFKKADDEYLIYVYSGVPELDKELNRFVKTYENDVKIYKLDMNKSVVEFSFKDTKYLNNFYQKPYFVLIDRLESNSQVEEGYYFEDNLGSIIEDVNKLKQRQKLLDGK